MNSRWRMRLCGATRSVTNAVIASAVVAREAASGLSTTKALGTSPASSSALRITADERSEEHTSELQSLTNLVCRLLLEKKKKKNRPKQVKTLRRQVECN